MPDNRIVKLRLDAPAHLNHFTGYGAGFVTVNQVRYEKHLIVLPDRIIPDWDVSGFAGLTVQHFEFLAGLNPEIVLLGSGPLLRFPHPALTRPLAAARVGLEVMDTAAACRTYNILTAEDRSVIAALLLA